MQLEATLKKTGTSKHWVNIVLSLVGIGIPLLSGLCEGSCSFLTGSIFSVDLKYIGILYMGMLLLFSLLKRSSLVLPFLSLGLGAEIQLVAFQIMHQTACYFCLAFGAVIFILFLLNFDTSKKIVITACLILGFILFSIFFQGMVTPLYAEEPPKADFSPSFGTGKTQIRLYTDYFCGPCSSLEPKLEKMIADLVKKDVASITFIDTPIHKYSSLYATYFLYILNGKRDFEYALRARATLFEAAKKKVTEKEKLEEYLKKRNIGFKPFDTKPTFKIYNAYFQEDKISATPTCVISNGEKKSFTGEKDITKALEGLHSKN
jgi:thiol:disulfide interchange protein DsbA